MVPALKLAAASFAATPMDQYVTLMK